MRYCGYLDILGTKSLADHDLGDLRAQMEHFHTALMDYFSDYKGGRCIAASDGAFYENMGIDDFFPYYRKVRNFLFDKSVFFKCSYIPGSIRFVQNQVDAVNPGELPRFLSLNFSDASSRAYRAEARLKGIGCSIEGFGKGSGSLPRHSVSNFFLIKDQNRYRPVEFIDFGFSRYEVSNPGSLEPGWSGEQRLVDKILYNISVTSMESDYVASKYVPLLVNAIRSSDFKNVSVTDKGWHEAPYILERIVGARSPISGFSRLPGFRFVILALYDKLFLDCDGEVQAEVERKIVGFIGRRRDCRTNLGEVPDFILAQSAKRSLIRKLTEFHVVSP